MATPSLKKGTSNEFIGNRKHIINLKTKQRIQFQISEVPQLLPIGGRGGEGGGFGFGGEGYGQGHGGTGGLGGGKNFVSFNSLFIRPSVSFLCVCTLIFCLGKSMLST